MKTIKFILDELDEMERSNISRLMKIKEMIAQGDKISVLPSPLRGRVRVINKLCCSCCIFSRHAFGILKILRQEKYSLYSGALLSKLAWVEVFEC